MNGSWYPFSVQIINGFFLMQIITRLNTHRCISWSRKLPFKFSVFKPELLSNLFLNWGCYIMVCRITICVVCLIQNNLFLHSTGLTTELQCIWLKWVFLKLQHTSESPRGLNKTQIPGLIPRVSDSVGLGCCLRIYVTNS